MIEYDIRTKLQHSGVLYPVVWLSKTLRCSKSKASNLLDGSIKNISPSDMTRICIKLGCTPLDFMVWNPDSKYKLPENHPLHGVLRIKEKQKSLEDILSSHPPVVIERMLKQLEEYREALLPA